MLDPKGIRLCITGSFGNRDIGDEAMLTADLDYILNEIEIPRNHVTLIGTDPDYVAGYHDHPRRRCFPSGCFLHSRPIEPRPPLRRRIKDFLLPPPSPDADAEYDPIAGSARAAARSCDGLLVTGGGSLNTRDREGRSVKHIHHMITYFTALGKPVFMSGQTIGPLGVHPFHDKLARETLELADVITVRDSLYSRRYVDLIGAEPTEFIESVDDAFDLPYEDSSLPPDVEAFLERGPAVAVNVTEYTSETPDQRAFVGAVCSHIIETHGLNVLLLGHTPADVSRLYAMRDAFGERLRRATLVPNTRDWRADVLKKTISRCRVAVGGRYHFIVFAATAGTPFVGMCGNHYSYIKQDGFARPLGLQDFILSERDTWRMDAVRAVIAKAFEPDQLPALEQPACRSMDRFRKWVASLGKGSEPQSAEPES